MCSGWIIPDPRESVSSLHDSVGGGGERLEDWKNFFSSLLWLLINLSLKPIITGDCDDSPDGKWCVHSNNTYSSDHQSSASVWDAPRTYIMGGGGRYAEQKETLAAVPLLRRRLLSWISAKKSTIITNYYCPPPLAPSIDSKTTESSFVVVSFYSLLYLLHLFFLIVILGLFS